MKKSLLQDLQVAEPLRLMIEESEGGKYRAKGEFARAGIATANRRIYPESIWKKEIGRLQEQISQRKVFGECDHPSDGKTKLSRVSHLVTKLECREDGTIFGEAEILDTSNGKELKAILDGGGAVGVSSRGYGSVSRNEEGYDVVQDDFNLMTFDFVADPANQGSYPEFYQENKKEVANKVEAAEPPLVAPAPIAQPQPQQQGADATFKHLTMKDEKEETAEDIKSKVAELWRQGKSAQQIEDELGIKLEIPGSIDDLSKNLLGGEFKIMQKEKVESKEVVEEKSKLRLKELPDDFWGIEYEVEPGKWEQVVRLGNKEHAQEIIDKKPSYDELKQLTHKVKVENDAKLQLQQQQLMSARMAIESVEKAEAQVETLKKQLAEAQAENVQLNKVCKEIGMNLWIERNLSAHPRYKAICESLDLSKFEALADLKKACALYLEDIGTFAKQAEIEAKVREELVAKLKRENVELQEQMKKVASEISEARVQCAEASARAYLEHRLHGNQYIEEARKAFANLPDKCKANVDVICESALSKVKQNSEFFRGVRESIQRKNPPKDLVEEAVKETKVVQEEESLELPGMKQSLKEIELLARGRQ